MKRGYIIIALLLILGSANAYAEGLTPGTVTVDFMPNLKTDLQFTAKGYNDISVETSCDYLRYNNDAKKNPDETISFTTTLTLPIKMAPGPTYCGVKISEKSPQTQGLIQTRIELIGTITINAPYHGEQARITLSAENANKGDPVNFIVTAENLGDKEITEAMAGIEITNRHNDKVATLPTGKKNINPGSKAKLTAQLDTAKYYPGKYKAKAMLGYDQGKVATDEKEFIIGMLQMNIISYPHEIEIGSGKPFEVEVESLWGKAISNAYATVNIKQREYPVAELKTASQTISPWQQATIKSEIDTTRFTPEEYDIEITLHYEGKQATKTGKISFKPKEEQPRKPIIEIIKETAKKPSSIAALIALIIILDIIWLAKKKPKKLPHLTLKDK